MTLTKKFGGLLLLLAVGPLIGILTFALFFARTAGDGLFLIAAQIEMGMLQQLQIQTLAIRDGQEEARAPQLKLIEGFDVLITAMENGGLDPASPVALLPQVSRAATDSDVERVVRTMRDGLPKPPPELEQRISGVRNIWKDVKEPLRTIGTKPADDPGARAAYVAVRPHIAELDLASRLILISVGNRISAEREQMMIILASIGGLSLVMFFIGLWFTKRYISTPLALVGQVERSVTQYRELFENASDIIYTMSLDGNFLTINRAGERITGYPREEFLRMNVKDILSSDQLEISNQMLRRKISGEQTMTTYSLQITRKTGETVPLEVGTRLIHEGGKPVAVQGLARDISERRRMEEQLWTAQKMEAVGRLAGGIAHEFGNVLTIIGGYCALLLGGMKKDDPLREEVEGIQKAGQRATSLIRHLLGFSKGQVFRPKTLNLCGTLDEIGEMLRRLIGEDINLTTQCDPHLGSIRFDPAQFEQIMVNLALNARDAMPSGGEFKIEARNVDLREGTKVGTDTLPAGSYITLRVSDTGCGMSADVASKAFEPFFSTKERGTGLGLSTVYGIVKQSGGGIGVESEAGKGTTITLFLPRFDAAASASASGNEAPSREENRPLTARGTETILLVEDNDDVRTMISQMLRTQGYNVVASRDHQQALAICSQQAPRIDMLLTDVVMPDMNGPELVGRIRALRPGIKVLYMSGYAEDKFQTYVEAGEHFEFIQKPISLEALAVKVRAVLDARRDGTYG